MKPSGRAARVRAMFNALKSKMRGKGGASQSRMDALGRKLQALERRTKGRDSSAA